MRRIVGGLAAALIAAGLAVAGGSPASAQCPGGDGTIPGSGSSTIALGLNDGTQYGTVYVDDRDYPDLDNDDVAGGLWLYVEHNGAAGLQRGGDHVAFTFGVNPDVPFIAPIVVLPPDPSNPVRPQGLTLFPQGFGGGSLSEASGSHDACIEGDGPKDAILF